MVDSGLVGAAQQPPAQAQAPGDPMRIIPADTLFCVRINKLATALSQVDQFLTGISPLGLSMPVRSQLGQFLGSPEPAGINMTADFAIFGPLPGGEKPDPKRVGILIPLSDHQQFLTNPNVAKPDAQGISRIGPEGKADLAGVKVGSFMLVTNTANQKALIEAKNWASGPSSLAQRLSPEELKRAQGSPVWAYANIQTLNKMFGPMLQQKIQEGKKKLQEAQAQGQGTAMMGAMGQPEAIIDMYTSLLNSLMQETQSVSLSLEPTATAIRAALVAAAMPDTEMAKILSMDGSQQQLPSLLGYLENGAIMNGVASCSPAFAKAISQKRIDLVAAMLGQALAKEDVARFRKLATETADVFGGAVAWSMSADLKSKPPFRMKYVATLKDRQKFNDVIDQSFKLMNETAMTDLLKKFGVKMQLTLQRNAQTYQDVPIDAIRVAMQPVDANAPQAQMMTAMLGQGLELRLAVVKDLLVYTLAADPDKEIRTLIDQAKAGGPSQVPSEVQAALQLIPDAKKADFFGTYNYLRAIQMALAFMPMPMPQIDVPTQSSIAFAGDIGGGRLLVNAAVPKQHVLELMMVFMKMQQQKMQEMQKQQPPAQP
jgi:hypothetical protein